MTPHQSQAEGQSELGRDDEFVGTAWRLRNAPDWSFEWAWDEWRELLDEERGETARPQLPLMPCERQAQMA
jgi:hypothetical protein